MLLNIAASTPAPTLLLCSSKSFSPLNAHFNALPTCRCRLVLAWGPRERFSFSCFLSKVWSRKRNCFTASACVAEPGDCISEVLAKCSSMSFEAAMRSRRLPSASWKDSQAPPSALSAEMAFPMAFPPATTSLGDMPMTDIRFTEVENHV